MRMDEIGYNHRHGRSFYIDRPEGTGDWLMLIIKSPAYFRVDGKDIKTSSCAFILYEPGAPQHSRLCHLLHKYQHEKIKNLRKIWDFLLTNSI